MIYLDTSVIIAYMDKKDPNHLNSEDLMKIIKNEDKVVSELTKIELASVFSRGNIRDPQAFAIYSIREVGATIIKVDFNKILLEAFKLSSALKLRTLDLLHVSACKISKISRFATFDKNIIAKRKELEKINIKIITQSLT